MLAVTVGLLDVLVEQTGQGAVPAVVAVGAIVAAAWIGVVVLVAGRGVTRTGAPLCAAGAWVMMGVGGRWPLATGAATAGFWVAVGWGCLRYPGVRIRSPLELSVVERHEIGPVVAAAAAAALCYLLTVLRHPVPGRAATPDLVPFLLLVAAIPLAVLVAAVRRRGAAARSVALLARVASPPTTASVAVAVAQCLHDRSVQVRYAVPDGLSLVDADGHRCLSGGPEDRLAIPLRSARGTVVGVILADPALRRRPDLVAAVAQAVAPAAENAQLQAADRAQLAELRASRTRIVSAALSERQRTERDLHDGAQQRLVAMAVRLGVARIRADSGTAAAIDGIRHELREALRELREFCRGIYPPVIDTAGLGAALEAVAEQLPLDLELDITADRFDGAIEIAAFVTAHELLVALAAAGAQRATVAAQHDGHELWLQVDHDGPETSTSSASSPALSVISDRVHALGGHLTLGPVVEVFLPCA